jgi:hypothetical protein
MKINKNYNKFIKGQAAPYTRSRLEHLGHNPPWRTPQNHRCQGHRKRSASHRHHAPSALATLFRCPQPMLYEWHHHHQQQKNIIHIHTYTGKKKSTRQQQLNNHNPINRTTPFLRAQPICHCNWQRHLAPIATTPHPIAWESLAHYQLHTFPYVNNSIKLKKKKKPDYTNIYIYILKGEIVFYNLFICRSFRI